MYEGFTGLADLPSGRANDTVTSGCLVLEGGAFRGLYTQGVLDAMMEHGINFQTVIGVSAGAMCGVGYVAGQIGWCARINLDNRHNSNYIGMGALRRDHGITGFSYLFDELMTEFPLDKKRFFDKRRRFVTCATDVLSGEPVYFDRDKCPDIFKAVQASATVPYVSEPVVIGGRPYLDGGATGSTNIPYDWAVREGYKKIIVIKTRDRAFRSEIKPRPIDRLMYRNYPKFERRLELSAMNYNALLERVDADALAGRNFTIAPSAPLTIARFERDIEKLLQIYYRGYNDLQAQLGPLEQYLKEDQK